MPLTFVQVILDFEDSFGEGKIGGAQRLVIELS